MSAVHNVVGTLVVLAFLANLGAYILRYTGRSVGWHQPVSIAAATLLLFQYLLGFSLLADDRERPASHYVFALLAILTVGLEHGYARSRATPRQQALWGIVATGGTFLLVLAAFTIGSIND